MHRWDDNNWNGSLINGKEWGGWVNLIRAGIGGGML